MTTETDLLEGTTLDDIMSGLADDNEHEAYRAIAALRQRVKVLTEALEQCRLNLDRPTTLAAIIDTMSECAKSLRKTVTALSRPSLEPTLGSHTEGVGAMPTARSGVLRTEPEDVSALRAPATIAKGEK